MENTNEEGILVCLPVYSISFHYWRVERMTLVSKIAITGFVTENTVSNV